MLLLAGLLLIAFTYAALQNPLAVIVSYLIPAGLALGLISEFYPKYEKSYLAFALPGLVAIAVTRFIAPGVGRVVLPAVFSGLAWSER